ncbi:sodium-dependent phosphate transport protein 3-like [Antedon mediterranea]|uniref:sodium-dependent phosphate transport protein 3-like n=1 Tax=Antedon mediterranea TaxID=105859 RepID=UPI003AF41588
MILLTLSFGFLGCYAAGVMANVMEVSKEASGMILGIVTCISHAVFFIGLLILGMLIKDIPLYDWDDTTQQYILGSFYYGYTLGGIPGGWFIGKTGGKPAIATALLLEAVLASLVPWASGVGSIFLIILRVLEGVTQALVFSAFYVTVRKWIVPQERSTLISIGISGSSIADAIWYPLSSWICNSSAGWPMSFYTCSAFSVIVLIVFMLFVYDDPEEDPFISNDELTFLKSFHETNNDKVGLIMAIPAIIESAVSILSGIYADVIIQRHYFSVINTRKFFIMITLGIPALCMSCIGFFEHSAIVTMTLLTLSFGCLGCYAPGVMANVIEVSKERSAVIMGISISVGNGVVMIILISLGILIKDDNTVSQWSLMFRIIAAINLFGMIFFLIFAKAEQLTKSDGNITKQEMKSYKTIKD